MIPLCINNEFGELKVAIVHDASNIYDLSFEDWRKNVGDIQLDNHPETGKISRKYFIKQHQNFLELLDHLGVQLIFPDTQDSSICQVYTRDPCFVIGNTLFVSSMRGSDRFSEIIGLKSILNHVENIIHLEEEDVFIEGGDVFLLDHKDVVLVGIGQITNEKGFCKVKNNILDIGIGKVEKIFHTALHIDCCLSPLPNGDALYSVKHLSKDSLNILSKYFNKLIPLDAHECEYFLSANMLWINREEVISNMSAKKTNAFLKYYGFKVHEMNFSQPVSMWGSFRCVTCPLQRDI